MSRDIPPVEMSFEQITEGSEYCREYTITGEIYERFLESFRDINPLHTDPEYARQSGFRDKVMHGAILNGFLSHFIGMVCPGRRSLLLSVELSYLAPAYLNDRLEINARVSQKVTSLKVVVLAVSFFNLTRKEQAARGKVQVKIIE